MSEDLKPCPFCGSEVELIPAHFENRWCVNVPSIICTKCYQNYKGSDVMQLGKSEAENEDFSTDLLVKWWNTRPIEDEKDKEIARLKEDLEIQKNLTRQACFESNRAYDETEQWKKMFYDLVDKQAIVDTNPKVGIAGKDKEINSSKVELDNLRLKN